ncbi:TolC family protein [Mucilaginibacter agri]|uniref:TolC family protein n=1 Tax=Mucilaginibacter agri TaxID=2695265 RepID=A0A965ZH79_9SPHI|nr:TolC family protein [Mucilaginibacter agri]NCD71029.1 TolC family protein [Mucilaginibacter agri]
MKYIVSFILCVLLYGSSSAQNRSLDYYLNQSLSNSPLLKDLNNQVLSAQLDSLRLKAGLKPQVNLNGGGLYAPVIRGYGYSQAITNGQSIDGLLSVNKTFVGKSYLNAQYYALQLQRDSLGNIIHLSEQDLKKNIIAQYITAYGDLQQYNFNKEVVELLGKEEDLLKKLTRSNVYRQSDYLTFLVTLQQQQLQLAQSRLQYKNDFALLNYLAGIRDTTFAQLTEPAITKAVLPSVANSIFFKQYKLDSLRLNNGRKLVDYSYRPKLNIFADGGYNSDLTYHAYKNFGASAGFSLIVPIYDGGVRKLLYKKLNLEEQSRQTYKAFFYNQYHQQIDQYSQQITENEKLIVQINDQIRYVESLIKVDTELMQTGDLKISDLILAINNYLTVKNTLTQTVISRLQLINQFNYYNR